MGQFQNILQNVQKNLRPMVLIASLPRNDPDLAQAALDGGADVVKFHINTDHHASGTHFGTLKEERPAIEKILRIWEGKLSGIVPGSTAELDQETLSALPALGVKFLSLYMKHAAVGALPPFDLIDRMLAPAYDDPVENLNALDLLPIHACELSFMHPDSYGQPFTYLDLARYAAIAVCTKLPLVVPTQHKIPPEAVTDLKQIGISAVMIGAIVAGHTPQQWFNVTSIFRKKMDNLWKAQVTH